MYLDLLYAKYVLGKNNNWFTAVSFQLYEMYFCIWKIIQTNYVSKNNMTMNDASPTKYFMNDVNEPDDSPIQQKKSQYQIR